MHLNWIRKHHRKLLEEVIQKLRFEGCTEYKLGKDHEVECLKHWYQHGQSGRHKVWHLEVTDRYFNMKKAQSLKGRTRDKSGEFSRDQITEY